MTRPNAPTLSDRKGHVDNVRELRPPSRINPNHPSVRVHVPLYDHTAEPSDRFVTLNVTAAQLIASILLDPMAHNDAVRAEAIELLRGER